MRTLMLVALLAVGCAGADSIEITPTDVAAPALEVWLPADSPAYDAQLAWGLPLGCDLTVHVLPLEELQPACNTEAELAARDPSTRTLGCAYADRCTIAIAAELSAEQRAVTLAHELGHVLGGTAGHIATGSGSCPDDAPGLALMCAHGPASGSPEPTSLDYAFVGAL